MTTEGLAHSNAELEQFSYIASHDLQEPLRKISFFSGKLKEKHYDSLDEDGRDHIDRMENASMRMQTLISDLLTYSRLTTKPEPFVSVELSQVAKDVLSDLEIRIVQMNARVELGDLPAIDVDPRQMQ